MSDRVSPVQSPVSPCLAVADPARRWPARDQDATNPEHITHGPYDSAEQAFADAEPLRRVLLDTPRAERHQAAADHVIDALSAAGVRMGAHDWRIAEWLAGWEPETVQVVIGWIERASAGRGGER